MYRFRDTLPIDISEQTISGDLVTIANPEEMGVVDSLEVSLEPIQDLNGYDKPWVGGAGKNKLETYDGISWEPTLTKNADGSIKVVGSRTDNGVKEIGSIALKANTTYTLSKSGNDALYYQMRVNDSSVGTARLTDFTYTPTEDVNAVIRIFARANVDFNEVLYPQIELGSTATTYEPYSNICPISGRTEVVTQRTGKNLLPNEMPTSGVIAGTITNSNVINSAANARVFAIPCKPNTDYNFNHKTAGIGLTVAFAGELPAVGNTTEQRRLLTNISTLTLNSGNNKYILINPASATGYANFVEDEGQIEVGASKTTYEPYIELITTTDLGRTVYGGTIDVVSGKLTVDRAIVDLGTLTWTLITTGESPYFRTSTDAIPYKYLADQSNYICENYQHISVGSTGSGVGIMITNTISIRIRDNNYSDAASFKTAMNGVQLVYELATPQTYQLTPQQIDLLLGANHLWSDGEISVVWHKDLTKGRILPTEAVSINGQYIENVLDGYRTLYTKGRESLGAELNTYSVGTADGEKFKNKRYPARELTVGFQLIADNAEDFREKFNNLNNLLSLDEADFIFHDEEDKFFSGYPIMNAEVEAGENSVKGEWKIYCAYPFKRSVDPITLTMADATVTNTTATFTIDYKGSQPARPVLRAKFAGAKSGGTSSEDGDCGFVAFMDARENIIQLGNPDVLDLDAYAKAGNLINYEFINTSGWTMTGGHRYKGTVTGTVATSDAVDAFWDGGAGQTQSYAKPSYGSGTGLHGSILWKNTAGASNFTLSAVHRLCVNNSNEVGVFELGAYNHSTGKMTAGFVIDKSGNGTTGTVRYIVNAKQVGTDQIDLSYYNTHFGYCNRTPVYVTQKYKKKTWVKVKVKVRRNKYKTKSKVKWVTKTRKVLKRYNYTQSNLNSSIKKDGINVYFQVGNLPRRTFNVPEIEQIVSHDASCYMGTYGTEMNTNMIHSMMFRKETGAVFAEQPNVFTAGDIVEADCNEATVNIYRAGSIGGHLEPQYGALGNDWESFKLTSGENIIRATWSDWVNPTYKPQIEIEYNEVFI